MTIPSGAFFQSHHSCASKMADHIQISSLVNFQSASTSLDVCPLPGAIPSDIVCWWWVCWPFRVGRTPSKRQRFDRYCFGSYFSAKERKKNSNVRSRIVRMLPKRRCNWGFISPQPTDACASMGSESRHGLRPGDDPMSDF